MSSTAPAGVADEAYTAGYRDGVTQALHWAAVEWPEDGMTRAEAQTWLEAAHTNPPTPEVDESRRLSEVRDRLRLAAVRALACEWGRDVTELRDGARRHGDMVADWHADARQQHLRQLRAALDTECATCSGRGAWMDEPCGDCASTAKSDADRCACGALTVGTAPGHVAWPLSCRPTPPTECPDCGCRTDRHGEDGCHAMDGNFSPCYCPEAPAQAPLRPDPPLLHAMKVERVPNKPRPENRHRMVRVEDELWNAAKEAASANDTTVSEIIRGALRRYVKRHAGRNS